MGEDLEGELGESTVFIFVLEEKSFPDTEGRNLLACESFQCVYAVSAVSVKSLLLELKRNQWREKKRRKMSVCHLLLSWEDRKHQEKIHVRCLGHNKYMVFFVVFC